MPDTATRVKALSMAWALVCDWRSSITAVRHAMYLPKDVLTRRERKLAEAVAAHLDEAAESTRLLQASLAERAQHVGVTHPDYITARNWLRSRR